MSWSACRVIGRSTTEEFVKRVEFYLSPDFLESWDDELEEMNESKVGRPYRFPEGPIEGGTGRWIFNFANTPN